MSENEFIEKIFQTHPCTYVVRIAYKYDHEKCPHISNEILYNDEGRAVWLNDWNEGQQHVNIISWIPIEKIDVTCTVLRGY